MEQAPEHTPAAGPKPDDAVTVARAEAARTGMPVAVAGETTQTSILLAQPDGTLTEDVASGPVRVERDGDWVPIDTTLSLDEAAGALVPAAVVGDRTVSAGGGGPLATVGSAGTTVAFTWPGELPEPVVSGDTATYRDVIDGVDLVVTVTSVGFSEQLVIDAPLADPGSVGELALSVQVTGGTVATGDAGSLTVTDTTGSDAGDVVVSAGAPVMWDAAAGEAAGTNGDVEPVDTELTAAGELVLTPDLAFLTDPGTVYPVTIDPAPALTALGDATVRSTTPTSPPSMSTQLAVGASAPGVANRSYLRFGVSSVAGYSILGASLDLWNSYSRSCAAATLILNRVADFNPATVTWNTAPPVAYEVDSTDVSLGSGAGCAAGAMYFDVKNEVLDAVSNATNLALGLVSDESDPADYREFNSGAAGSHVPTLRVSYTDNCSLVSGYYICDEIRDAWTAAGGLSGWGAPLSDSRSTTPRAGIAQSFENAEVFWSPTTGAHAVTSPLWAEYWYHGQVDGFLGFPTGDAVVLSSGGGKYQDFEGGSIYYSDAYGASSLAPDFVARYRALGAQDSFLGYPTTDTYSALDSPTEGDYIPGSGGYSEFAGGLLARDQASSSIQPFAGWLGLAGLPGWGTRLDFRVSDTLDATVDAGTGNLNLSVAGLATAGIGGDRTVGINYNSLSRRTQDTPLNWDAEHALLDTGFQLTDAPDTLVVAYPDQSVRYFDAAGRAVLYRWTGTAYESPIGDGGTRLERDANGNWVLTTLASNRKQTFRASDGLPISDTDRNGNTVTFPYGSAFVPTGITGTRGGAKITLTTGGSGVPTGHLRRLSQTIDGTTRTVVFGYDSSSDHLTSVTDASGVTTRFGWTGELLTSITDGRGIVTAIQYDSFYRVTQVVRDYGGGNYTTGFAWDTENRNGIDTAVTRVTDPRSGVTTYTVDGFGKVLDATDPLGHKKATTYSPNNDVLTAVDAMPGANTTSYTYNGADGGFTPTGATLPTGASASAAYPTTGNGPARYQPTSSTDTQGNASTYAYDGAGNPTQQVTGGVTTTTTYNPPAGQATVCAGGGKPGQACTSTDGRGSTTTYTYNSVGNLVTVTPPSGVIKPTSYTYDGAGRPKTVTDGKGQVTTYVYDKNDRVTQVRYNGATSCSTASNCEVYTYDGNGNLTQRVDGAGTTTYTYNSRNLLSGQTTASASGGGSKSSTLAYDANGNLTGFTEAGATTTYGYDAGNNLVSLAEPGGSCTGTVSLCTRYEYNANDVRTKITYPGGTTVNYLQIDASNRPLQYRATTAGGAVLMDFTYSFTSGGVDTGLVQTRSDATVAGTAVQTYRYDGLNRLTQATETVGAVTAAQWTYCYDANGNRTYDSTSTAASVLCPGQSGGPAASYTYDATNALTARAGQPATAFGYDDNGAETAGVGSTTRTAGTWNARGQLTGLTTNGTAHTFAYAGETNKERTAFDGAGYQNTALGITTQTGTGAATTIREPGGTPVAIRIGGVSYYYIADRQGSIVAVVNSAGVKQNSYSYDPYGVSRAKTENITNPWQYIGSQYDATTSLYHLQNRYYDPNLGRFTQPDPSGREANAYGYVSCNPVNAEDPTGLSPLTCGVAIAAFVLENLVPLAKIAKIYKVGRSLRQFVRDAVNGVEAEEVVDLISALTGYDNVTAYC